MQIEPTMALVEIGRADPRIREPRPTASRVHALLSARPPGLATPIAIHLLWAQKVR